MKRLSIVFVWAAVLALSSCSKKVPDFVNSIPDDAIAAILLDQPAAQAAGWALIEAANLAGGEDNITVAIIDVLE